MLNAAAIETPERNEGRRREKPAGRQSLRLVEASGNDATHDYYERALLLWPRLDRARLGRLRHDRERLAALVARRTALALDAITALLDATPDDHEPGAGAPVS